MTLLLLRHGEITQASPVRFVGQRDLPLTSRGRAQALAWAPALAALPLDAAYCSDLSRCRDTAALALSASGLAAAPLPALREICLGGWEGLTVDEVRARFPGEHERRGRDMADARPSGGESFRQAQARFLDALLGLPPAPLVLVVAHGGVIRAAACALLGLRLDSLFRIGQDYCGLNLVELRPAPLLRALNLHPPFAADALAALRSPGIR